jgi:hypothetical protein
MTRQECCDRPLGVQLLLNADRLGNESQCAPQVAQEGTTSEEMRGGSPPPEDTIATDEAR